MRTSLQIVPEAIKLVGLSSTSPDQINAQAELGQRCLMAVDYATTHGTCGDERARIGLLSGAATIEVRPSVFGGPDIHALAIAELTGIFDDDDTDAMTRLRIVKQRINQADIKSGGHVNCAANAGFKTWMTIIATNPEAIKTYAMAELGNAYDDALMDEIVSHANHIIQSDRYDNWNETVLVDVLGDEAGQAIERLIDAPHEGLVVERNRMPNTTIDQTAVYDVSVAGKGNFNVDDHYAAAIETAVLGSEANERNLLLAAHARESIIAAVATVVPNTELYEARIVAA